MPHLMIVSNAEVYAPNPLGRADILVGGGKILAIRSHIDPSSLPAEPEMFDASGNLVVPGFVDGHQHFIGGGGEGGFKTRTPALQLSINIMHGVTTAVGLLGTDSLTRALEDLYARTVAFNEEGMTTFMLTGAYWHPSPTITGSVSRDIVFCQPVIGVKLALSDTRGPHITADDLAALASEVQVAGLISGKAGIVTIHTGVRTHALDLICEVVDRFELRPGIFVPTHLNRKNPKLLEQVFSLARRGMHADATCLSSDEPVQSEKMSAADFLLLARDEGVFDKVTFSSDAGGSMPIWNEDRSRILGMGIGKPDSLLRELRTLVYRKHLPLEEALLPLTRTPAWLYGLQGRKGALAEGFDADLLVLDRDTMDIKGVVARGSIMMKEGELLKKGYFE